ncbi:hypothetical protein ACNKHU_04445 [Shigella flexneri]
MATQVDDLLSEISQRAAINERVLVTTLTKRMAEILPNISKNISRRMHYLQLRYDAVERMEIIRDLRLGAGGGAGGNKLLREGLDMPEVSALVEILDADEDGSCIPNVG